MGTTISGKTQQALELLLGKVEAADLLSAILNASAASVGAATSADLTKLHGMTAAAATLNQVAAAAGTVTFDRSKKWAKVALAAVDTAGGVFAWVNPEAGSIIVFPPVINVTTPATAACSIDVGAQATGATTLSDNLLDGIDVHTAAGAFGQLSGDGTNGLSCQVLAAGKWVTGSVVAGGASAGLVGFAYIPYINV